MKIVLKLIALLAFIVLLSILDNYYLVYRWYAGNWKKLLQELFPYNILEILALVLCIIGGIKSLKYTPLLGIVYIRSWLFNSITLFIKYINNPPTLRISHYSWDDSLFFHNVFLLDWLGTIAFILLSVACILGVIMLVKDKFTSQA